MVYTIIFTLMMVVGLLCSFVASFDVPWQRRTVVGTSSLPLKVSSQFRNGGQKLPFQPQQCVGRTLRAKNLVELTAAATSENEEDDDALFDLIVLGAGPVGVSAALASAELGKKVCLVDAPAYSGALMKGKEDLSFGGPTGLFSKALRDTSKRLSVSTLRGMGISEDSIWAEARLVCEQLAAVNSRDRRRALRSAGITYVQGFARFAAKESGPPSGPASVHRVLVETAAAAAATTAMRTAEDVAELFDSLDVDKNGHLSFEEFKQAQFGSEGSINGGGGGSSGDVAGEERRRASAAADTAVAIQGVNVLVATGSRAFKPLNIPFARAPSRLFDSDTINGLSFLPKSIAITGSGIIAIEYAKIFQKLGADVTLIIRDKVPKNALMKVGLDSDLAAALVTDLVRSGIAIERGVVATHFDLGDESTATASSTSNKGKSVGGGQGQGQNQGGNKDEAWGGLGDDMLEQSDLAEASLKARKSVKITLAPRDGESDGEAKDEKVLEVDCYLAAVGRVSNTAGLGLDERVLGPDQELKELVDAYGGIKVANGYAMETCVKRVYAAGDVVGRPYLASTGVAQGAAAVSHMFEKQSSSEGSGSGALFDLSADPFAFPVGVWSSPECAYFGLTKAAAVARGMGSAGEGLALYRECLRGCVFSPEGLLKIVYDKQGSEDGGDWVIVGVHVVGEDACELIHYGMELVKSKRTVKDVANSIYSAVTFHELYQIAARAALDPTSARRRRKEAGAAWASLAKKSSRLRSSSKKPNKL